MIRLQCKWAGGFAAMIASTCIMSTARADSILVPNENQQRVIVLDATSGSITGSFDTSSYAAGLIEVIDGIHSGLIACDEEASTILKLNEDGTYRGNFFKDDGIVSGIHGIEVVRNGVLVGATGSGLYSWRKNAAVQDANLRSHGNYFDVGLINDDVLAAVNIGSSNLEGYDTGKGKLLGETVEDSLQFPRQVARIERTEEVNIAVASVSLQQITMFDLNGEEVSSFDVNGGAVGVLQLDDGRILVSSTQELAIYTLEGVLDEVVLSGSGFGMINRSLHYRP